MAVRFHLMFDRFASQDLSADNKIIRVLKIRIDKRGRTKTDKIRIFFTLLIIDSCVSPAKQGNVASFQWNQSLMLIIFGSTFSVWDLIDDPNCALTSGRMPKWGYVMNKRSSINRTKPNFYCIDWKKCFFMFEQLTDGWNFHMQRRLEQPLSLSDHQPPNRWLIKIYFHINYFQHF